MLKLNDAMDVGSATQSYKFLNCRMEKSVHQIIWHQIRANIRLDENMHYNP